MSYANIMITIAIPEHLLDKNSQKHTHRQSFEQPKCLGNKRQFQHLVSHGTEFPCQVSKRAKRSEKPASPHSPELESHPSPTLPLSPYVTKNATSSCPSLERPAYSLSPPSTPQSLAVFSPSPAAPIRTSIFNSSVGTNLNHEQCPIAVSTAPAHQQFLGCSLVGATEGKVCSMGSSLPTLSPLSDTDKSKVTYRPAKPPQLARDSRINRDISRSFGHSHTGTMKWDNYSLSHAISSTLSTMMKANEEKGFGKASEEYSCFYSKEKKPYCFKCYIHYMVCYFNCPISAYIIMLEYVKRLQEQCKQFAITYMNFERVILACLLLATKYLDDEVCRNEFYANIGGIPVEELNELEAQVLEKLGWNVSVCSRRFAALEKKLGDIIRPAPWKWQDGNITNINMGRKRGRTFLDEKVTFLT